MSREVSLYRTRITPPFTTTQRWYTILRNVSRNKMAKKALLDVLEQTIGKYVRNLDAESLNIAIWSGKIELNSLRLDCDSVNAEISRQAAEAPNLAIPFKVVSGVFEHFEVDVPWSQLMSRSVVLRASGLIVEVEPFNHSETADYLRALHENEATRAKQVQDQRDQSINLAEKYRNQANALRDLAAQDLESSLTQSSQTNSNSTFATRLVRRIIENIQIEIMDVKIIVQGADCSAGVSLDSLTLVTTDKDGKRVFVDRTTGNCNTIDNSFLYKNLRIAGFGIYLDEDKVAMTRLSTITEDNENNSVDHSYVLAPLSFEASLGQADSNICVEYPKYLLSSELRSISVLLSKPQLESAYRILEQMRPSFDVAKPLFLEYRPLQRVTKETVVISVHWSFKWTSIMG
jgi:vacuolar protein sorting-associated protein 13A/C